MVPFEGRRSFVELRRLERRFGFGGSVEVGVRLRFGGLLFYVCDERMRQQLGSRHALRRFPLQTLGDEVEGVLGTVGQGTRQGDFGVLREIDSLLAGVLEPLGPVLHRGRSDH